MIYFIPVCYFIASLMFFLRSETSFKSNKKNESIRNILNINNEQDWKDYNRYLAKHISIAGVIVLFLTKLINDIINFDSHYIFIIILQLIPYIIISLNSRSLIGK